MEFEELHLKSKKEIAKWKKKVTNKNNVIKRIKHNLKEKNVKLSELESMVSGKPRSEFIDSEGSQRSPDKMKRSDKLDPNKMNIEFMKKSDVN